MSCLPRQYRGTAVTSFIYLAARETEYFAVGVVIGFPCRGHAPTATLHDNVFPFSDKIFDRVLGGAIELHGDLVEEFVDDVLLLSFNRAGKFGRAPVMALLCLALVHHGLKALSHFSYGNVVLLGCQ